MMYLKCPTCNTVIGNRNIKYAEQLERIINDLTLTNENKRKLKSELVNSLGLPNPCCKMRVMSYVELIGLIQ